MHLKDVPKSKTSDVAHSMALLWLKNNQEMLNREAYADAVFLVGEALWQMEIGFSPACIIHL